MVCSGLHRWQRCRVARKLGDRSLSAGERQQLRYRNKFPRPAGQGASRIERLVVGISGSQTGGQGVLDISLPELVQSGGSFSNWPLNLPPAGSQTTATLNVPYRFMGVTEELSWLAQFAGQGFEDISALANLIMLQEMMLG